MSDDIPNKVKIVDPYATGVINDHVSVQKTGLDSQGPRIYSVFARQDYNVGKGPRTIPRVRGEDHFQILEHSDRSNPRGWGNVDTLCQEATLEEALAIAEPEAKRRGVVLYLDEFPSTAVKWRPEGWEPRIG